MACHVMNLSIIVVSGYYFPEPWRCLLAVLAPFFIAVYGLRKKSLCPSGALAGKDLFSCFFASSLMKVQWRLLLSGFKFLSETFFDFLSKLVTTSRVLLMWVAHHKSKLLIWLQLFAWLVNRGKDLVATTDAHHRPVQVHTQRPGKCLQTKSESLHAKDSAIQNPDQNRNYMSHSLYNHPYALNHIQLLKQTFNNYEVNIFKVLAMIYHRFYVEK